MKLLLFLLIPFISDPSSSANIFYHQLTWNDFKGKPDGRYAGTTCSGTEIESKCVDDHCTLNIYTDFDPEKSYLVTRNADLLKHEQGHLDISEIFTRKLIETLKPFQGCKKSLLPRVWYWLDKNAEERNKIQDQYDDETNHSTTTQAQERWNAWIQEQLKY